MDSSIHLLGLDFGTTTSSAVAARGRFRRNAVTGRIEVADLEESFRSELVYTPQRGANLDLAAIETLLDSWLQAAGLPQGQVFGGGALLTGLTAQRPNTADLVARIKARLGNALVAQAKDPCLESWLAFMGSCLALSREVPDRNIVNFDIGGGTTNIALGKAGEVLRVGCLFVGARHLQVTPGTYRLLRLSSLARELLAHLQIDKGPGDTLTTAEVERILDFYLALLIQVLRGEAPLDFLQKKHEQVPVRLTPEDTQNALVTFSGGVGELIYRFLAGGDWPTTTYFGDLGVDLAQRLVAADAWGSDWRRLRPASSGRATVYGLLRHNTELAGATIFLPRPETLPRSDVPILGTIALATSPEQIRRAFDLLRRSEQGGCLRIDLETPSAESVRRLAFLLRSAMMDAALPPLHPIVLLLEGNVGKLLGQTISAWQTPPWDLIVLDEIAVPDAHYLHVGAARQGVVPVSFYGLRGG